MVSNGLVGLSGALLSQYQGFADINMGRGSIVIGLAAVVIGEVLFSKIFRNFALKLLSVAFGSIIYYVVIQVILWTKLIDSNDLEAAVRHCGSPVLGAALLEEQILHQRRKERSGEPCLK